MKTGVYRLRGTLTDLDTKLPIALDGEYTVVIDGVLARIARHVLYEQILERGAGESGADFEGRVRAVAPVVSPSVESFEHEHRVRTAEVATIAEPLD